MNKKSLALIFPFLLSFSFVFAQAIPGTLNWYNGEGNGMFTEVAYKKLLSKKKSTTVIVAVIDSGVDIEHEDLAGHIWINTKEIPNNNKDDDGNGYVDDINGWNFLGNKKGENVDKARLEKARIVSKYQSKFENANESKFANDPNFKLYKEAKASMEADREQYAPYMEMIGKGMFDKETEAYLTDQMDFNLNPKFDDRSIIGDNPDDFNDKFYGNGNAEGPDALHGTHVAGIIAAVRGNKKGGDGVADDVKIMSIRAVPNGDEHDKDVALAIRYAVDNGAKVINMSFGKSFSPYSEKVQDAIAYAASKDVLLIHAAGNDAANVDEVANFPHKPLVDQPSNLSRLMFLNVGANTKEKGEGMVADFSNYGAVEVDVFAPGNEIYNSVPQSEYKNLQGTSMAAPMVAGVAALLKSRYPSASMMDICNAITSTVKKYSELKNLCNTGGVVNVYNAAMFLEKKFK